MGEKSRIGLALVPSILINALVILGLGALLGLGLERSSAILPVALMHERVSEPAPPPPPAPQPAVEAEVEEPPRHTPRKPRHSHVLPDEPGGEIVAEAASPAPETPAPEPEVAPQPAPETSEPAPPPPPAPKKDISDDLELIRAKLQEHLVYPPVAKLNRMEGTVKVAFEVGTDGRPRNIRLKKGSGFDVLDQAALKTVKASAPFPVVDVTVKVPVVFELN